MKTELWSALGCTALVFAVVVQPTAAAEVPDVAVVAAALRSQEKACGSSLEVRYAVTSLKPRLPHGRTEYRYVRTPDVLFKEESKGRVSSDGFDVETTSRSRYDRSSGACVILVAPKYMKKKVAIRLTDPQISEGFVRDVLPDPVLYPLRIGSLCAAVSQGTISDTKEDVDGNACWRIDIASKQVGIDSRSSWSIWVDPAVGFCPRRIRESRLQDGESAARLVDFAEYKSICSQVYFPMRITVRYDDAGTSGLLCVVQEATCGKEVTAEETAVTIPSGTKVSIPQQQLEYVEP